MSAKKTKSSKTPSAPKASTPAKKRAKPVPTLETPATVAVVVPGDAPATPAETTPQNAPEAASEANGTATDAANAQVTTETPAPKIRKVKEPKIKKPSGLDAAAQVLKDKGEPMSCKDMVDQMLAKGLWTTNGKTPAATLYSAILREIDGKPSDSRFQKTGRGLFALTDAKV